jgi:hypothetical protein
MAVLVGFVSAAIVVGTPFAHASPSASEDGADTFNVAAGTAVAATTTKVTISAPGAGLVITCTASGFAGKTGTTLKFSIGLPSFSDGAGKPCTDNLGFTDTFKSGTLKWTLTERDFTSSGYGDEGLTEPNATGDRLVIGLPTAGLTDTNNWPCMITFAPAGASSISGAYNDAGVFTVKGAKVPVSVSGPSFCGPPSQTVTITVTYKLSPLLFDQG